MGSTENNRYQLLFADDEGTPAAPTEEVVKKVESKPAPAANVKKPQNSNKQEKGAKSANAATKTGSNKVLGAVQNSKVKSENAPVATTKKPSSGNVSAKPNYTDREQRAPRRFNAEGEFGNDRQPRQFRDGENRGFQRNQNFRGAPRAHDFRGGKREFDRQSGSDRTGVKAVDKREGAGAHNWGSVKEDIEDANKKNFVEKEEQSTEQNADQVIPQPEEEDTKEMTLDEWKALTQQRAKPQFNIRKPNEGEDTSQWNQMVALNKKKEGDSDEEFEFDPTLYPQRVGRMQRIVDIQFNFNDSRRGGAGFGRGRGPRQNQGDRYRGNNQGENTQGYERKPRNERQRSGPANVPKVDDERQFPTLG